MSNPDSSAQLVDRAVMTMASGKPVFVNMAINLARSFKLWHGNSDIRFALVTDLPELVPDDVRDIEIIKIKPDQFGKGMTFKLHINDFAPAAQTLYLDADMLCVGNLENVFDRFAGRAMSAVGIEVTDGTFWADVKSLCQRFKVPYLPKFCGGLYYVEKGNEADRVFETARQLEPQYDEMGMVRWRNIPNDEPIVSIAMALNNQRVLTEDGTIKAETYNYPTRIELDVLRGHARLINSPLSKRYNEEWHLNESRPCLVHFTGDNAETEIYLRETAILAKVCGAQWSETAARVYAWAKFSLPMQTRESAKNVLRPAYHKLFGARKLKPDMRT